MVNGPAPNERRQWRVYQCTSCSDIVLAEGVRAPLTDGMLTNRHFEVQLLYPATRTVDGTLPPEAQRYLKQALDTQFAPDASILMSASAVDAMLKAKGYNEGSLYTRIDKAVADHLLTEGMGTWAHRVRLEANSVRHADAAKPPTQEDAHHSLEFAVALGDFLFVLVARVAAGVKQAGKPPA